MKKIIINALVLTLFVGNVFSSEPAQNLNKKHEKRLRQRAMRNQAISSQNANLQVASSSSSSSAPTIAYEYADSFHETQLGEPLNDILGRIAFKNKVQARNGGISFYENNDFTRKELVVVPFKSLPRDFFFNRYPHMREENTYRINDLVSQMRDAYLYCVILGRKGQSNSWYVQSIPTIQVSIFDTYSEFPVEAINAEDIGKMLIDSEEEPPSYEAIRENQEN